MSELDAIDVSDDFSTIVRTSHICTFPLQLPFDHDFYLPLSQAQNSNLACVERVANMSRYSSEVESYIASMPLCE